MSSHHIVRDNQEPALLVLDTNQIAFDIIEELLEWSPAIIIDESQIEFFLTRGIKIDAVIFKKENEQEVTDKICDQLPVHLLQYSTESSLTRALSFLNEKNHSYVNIISNSIDFLDQLKSLPKPKNISVFHQNIRWSLVRSGHYEKWIDENMKLYLFENGKSTPLNPDRDNRIKVNKSENFWIGEKLRD